MKFIYIDFLAANLGSLRAHLGELVITLFVDDIYLFFSTTDEVGKVLDSIWSWHAKHDVDVISYKATVSTDTTMKELPALVSVHVIEALN